MDPLHASGADVHSLAREEVICSLALLFSGILCSAAGIGGGGIYVAVLMVLGCVQPFDAVPLSKAIVLLGALSSLAVNIGRAGGQKSRSVIDFHVCKNLVPTALLGTCFGVMLNPHTNDKSILLILSSLLLAMAYMVCKTAFDQIRAENSASAPSESDAKVEASEERAERAPLLPQHGPGGENAAAGDCRFDRKGNVTHMDLFFAATLISAVILAGVLRVTASHCDGSGSGCPQALALRRSYGDAAVEFMTMAPPMLCGLILAAYYGRRTLADTCWRCHQVAACQAVGLFTGVVAGLVGVGGGLVISPFLLLSGFEPAVAVGTSSTCVLFTSMSTTLQYTLMHRIPVRLAVIYGSTTFVASAVGTTMVHVLAERFARRKSLVTTIVAVGVLLSAALVAAKYVGLSK